MKILVVDDDPDILRMCAAMLVKLGHEVTTCSAGQSALQAALMGNFDLALCDLNLPDVHGLEIVRAIKMHAPELPVIVISALDPHEWEPLAGNAGAAHFIQKPFQMEDLRLEIEMAEASRTTLSVVLQDDDRAHRRLLYDALVQGGCKVRLVDTPLQAAVGDRPSLVIVDSASPGSEAVVRWCKAEDIHCFVLVEGDTSVDDRLLRQGASLIVKKPVEPEAILIQAKFLAAR